MVHENLYSYIDIKGDLFRGGSLFRIDMGGCFPCFESSDEKGNAYKSNNGVKEVAKKESFKEGSVAHSNSHTNRVSSGT